MRHIPAQKFIRASFDFIQGGFSVTHRDRHSDHAPVSADGLRIGIVVSRYHHDITDALLSGAERLFIDAGGNGSLLHTIEAPGTFELPVLCAAIIHHGVNDQPVDGVVALGCVITGETTHDQYINIATSSALAHLAAQTGVPIGFGVLTCQHMQQALERAGGSKGNKGADGMQAVIATIRALEAIGANRNAVDARGCR